MTSPAAVNLTPQSTMDQIMEAFPSAKRALFTRFHIGGCSSCGFEPGETLDAVLKKHGVSDVSAAIEHIKASQEVDDRLQIAPQQLAELLKEGKVKLLDLRRPEEHRMLYIEGDTLLTDEMAQQVKNEWAKDTPMVLYCHFGNASLDAAAYLAGHGFTNVRSLKGGIDAWSLEVDSLMPRY